MSGLHVRSYVRARWAAPVTCNWVFPFSLCLFYLFFTPKPTGAWRRKGFEQQTAAERQLLLWKTPFFRRANTHTSWVFFLFFANGADTTNEIIRLRCDCRLLSSFCLITNLRRSNDEKKVFPSLLFFVRVIIDLGRGLLLLWSEWRSNIRKKKKRI